MITVTFLISGLIQFILLLFVLSRRFNSLTNISFAGLTLATIGWTFANYFSISDVNSTDVVYALRFVMFFVVIQNTFFYIFARTFPSQKWVHSKKYLYTYILFSLITALLTLSPYVFVSAEIKNGIAISHPGPGMAVFMTHAFISISAGMFALLKKLKNSNSKTKKQLQLIFIASLINWTVVPITNFALTAILETTFFVELSPFYTLAFTLVISYTIVAYKLFDIRGIVVRSVGYLLTIGSVAAVYGGLVFVVGDAVGMDEQTVRAQQVFYLVAAIVASIFFNPFKSIFDKLTKKIFYQDAYNTQVELDKLSSLAVSRYEIEALVDDALELLSAALKPSKGKFILLDAHGDYYNDYHLKHTPRLDALKAIDVLSIQKEKVFIIDNFEFENDKNITHSKKEDLYEYLKSHDVAMSVRLSTKDEVVGYMLFGPKLSGNIYSRQDIQFIGIAANELAIAIQNARRFDEIQQFNETLKLEVERATGELRASNEKLQALDIAKDEFITMASHQLRTPLTSVKGYLSMVLEGDTGKINKKQREMLGAAFSSSQRMVYLIGDLLNVSRLQTGKFIIEPTVVDVPDMIKSEIEQLAETAKSKDLKLSFRQPKKFPELYMDETKTRQVIMNFIDNAIYYTPNGGKIDVELKSSDKSVEFTVTDNGIGVPKSEAHNLFTKFYRAANARKARPDGTGLGLFMAKKVIVDQGGAIIFHSKEGEGSTFGFSFPLTRVRPPKKLDEKQKK